MRWISLLLALHAAVAPACAQSETAARIDAVGKAYAEKRGFMGAALVAKGDAVVLEKGYGMANLEWNIPNAPDTRFRLGSLTKQFTAALVLKLVEEGKLSLDDPISKYVDSAPEAWKGVTIHHLLTHTSGILSYTDMPGFNKPERMRIPLKPLEIAMLSRDKPLEFQPGERMKYNNTGYVLLGYIIEKTSGQKWEDFLKAAVLDPLGMKNTGYDWTVPLLERRASGYLWSGHGYSNAAYLDMSLPHAAGSMYSTVRDLYLWHRALRGEKVLTAASLSKMFTPFKGDYAFGWSVRTGRHGVNTAHGGGINGFSTFISRYPGQDAVVIVLSNVQNGNAAAVADGMSKALFGEPVEFPWDRQEISVNAEALERFAGRYSVALPGRELPVTVTVEAGKLMLQPEGQSKLQVFAQSPTRFFAKVAEVTFEFVPGDDGVVREIVVEQGGGTFRGKRMPSGAP